MKFMACRRCGTVGIQAICDGCGKTDKQARERNRRRPNRQARGYGKEYDQARRELATLIGDTGAAARRAPAGADRRFQAPARGQPDIPRISGIAGNSDIRCVVCALVINAGEPWTAEHITPLRKGGTSELANLGHAHARCNYGWRASR